MNESTKAYFGPGLLRFLRDLKVHNDRGWFQANKERYEAEVRDPFLRLITDLAPELKKIGPGFSADPSPNRGSMMRIYRDIRFSKDKSPYKTHVAAHFSRAKGKPGTGPAYYVHFEPGASVVAGGMWQPEPKALKKVRDRMVARPEEWRRAVAGHEFGSACAMSGEVLKRPPAGYDQNHPLIEDLKRKDFVFSSAVEDRDITSDRLIGLLLDRCRSAAPFVQFLSDAVGVR